MNRKRRSQSRTHWLVSGAPKPFTSTRDGHCRGCATRFNVGSSIVSAGKGFGAFHTRCWRIREGMFNPPALKRWRTEDTRFKENLPTDPERRKQVQADREATKVAISRWSER